MLNDLDSYGGLDPSGICPLLFKKVSATLALLGYSGYFLKMVHFLRHGALLIYPQRYSIISKIFECIAAKRLVPKFLEANELLTLNQFAYRKGLDTTCIIQAGLDKGR